MNVRNKLSEAETETIEQEDPMQDEPEKKNLAKPIGMISGGGVVGALLVFILNTAFDGNAAEHDSFKNRLNKIELDVTELRIETAKQAVGNKHIVDQLTMINAKLEKIMEK